jgi:hypothetical protein
VTTSPVEQRIRESLHSLAVAPAADRLGQVIGKARRRRHRQTAALAVFVVVVGTGGVLTAVRPWSPARSGLATPSSYPGDPPIRYVGHATATGILEDNVTRFGSPRDPSAAIPARDALHDAWLHRSVSSATAARLVLAYVTASKLGGGRDAWIVIFYGHARRPTVGPGRAARSVPAEPSTEVLDARTGHLLFTFSGGPPRDPMTILISKPGDTVPIEGDLLAVGGPSRSPATPLHGTVTFSPLASRGPSGQTPPTVTVHTTHDGHFVANLQRQSYGVYATSPQYNRGHSRCYTSDRNPIDPETTRNVTIYCQER